MKRTIINLEPDDKSWLDHTAASLGISMTALVSRAIKQYRAQAIATPLPAALAATRGCWQRDDLDQLRDEWEGRLASLMPPPGPR
jgi:hypothetical protein